MLTGDDAVHHLVDTLLPGGAGFPAARDTGMAPLLLARLRQADATLPARLLAAVTRRGTPPDGPAWTAAASRLAAVEPRLFDEFRKHAYLAYYEQPAVIEAIRALGHPYNDSPLPDGYPDEDADPARDAPTHARGRWTATADVRPVDVSALGLEPLR